ncbi:MAG: branched-chain amino acid ABC transporter permease [Christensenellaceae bacterium]|jgi:branched-chain amino acid transport system permease protein|nr:branched-chain amino acid ABC transporter permease [Christensenellaceae bacterium]
MKKLSKNNVWMLIAFAVAVILPNTTKSSSVLQIMVVTMMYAFFTTAWNISGGYAGQLGLGNGVYIGIGAYITGILFNELHVSPWFGLLAGGVFAAIISLGMGSFTFKLQGTYYSLATVALLAILRIFLNENRYIMGWDFGGPAGLKTKWLGVSFQNMQFMDKRIYYYIALGFLMISLLACWHTSRSKSGYYFRAIDTNQEAAASLGVNVMQYKLQAQFISALLMGMGGGFYVAFYQFIDTETMFNFELSFQTMLMAVIGGRATVFGPAVAACLLIPFNELLRRYFGTALPGLPMLLYGLILMATIQFMPQGVIPFISEKLERRKAGERARLPINGPEPGAETKGEANTDE